MKITSKSAICIMGPTASGKTHLSLELAKYLPIEIISVDSATVYIDLNIGTSKPTKEELAQVPHHMIDILDPTQAFSVAEFIARLIPLMLDIHARGKIPVLVGGTMMYFYTLDHGLSSMPASSSDLRELLMIEAAQVGWPSMHAKLATLDPLAADKIKPYDQQRIIRALEVCILTGDKYSNMDAPSSLLQDWHIDRFIINPDKELLRDNIAKRLTIMLNSGWVDEVIQLIAKYNLSINSPSMRMVGYKQIFQYLNNEIPVNELKQKIFYATCQLAKRQRTWLNKWPHVKKINTNVCELLDSMAKPMLD